MNDRQQQTEFLRQCILYDGSQASQKLAERVRQLQHNERCVGRAVRLMILSGALALAGLAYLAVFMEDFPGNIPGLMTRFITHVFCVMGLSSLICLPVFLGLQAVYRKDLAHRREDCRRLATKLLESRLAKPCTPAKPEGDGERQGSESIVWAPAANGPPPVETTVRLEQTGNSPPFSLTP